MSRPLILILSDQLSTDLPLLRNPPDDAVVALCEVAGEGRYVPHHPQKIALLFSAMRHFADGLRQRGFEVHYSRLEDEDNYHDLLDEAERLARLYHCSEIRVIRPGDWRLYERMTRRRRGRPAWQLVEDDRFFCSPDGFADWAGNRRQLRMEHFYRLMRRESGLLMDGDEPAGGQWNFDHDNREPLPDRLDIPAPPRHQPDDTTREVLELVERHFGDHFGSLEGFNWPVTRRQALSDLRHFINHLLADFGCYQDAISDQEPFLFHSRLSVSLNTGLLSPREVCDAAERAWREERAPINAVEGFIRQILGWREFVRGVYWLRMPAYKRENRLQAERGLPDFYWSGETEMRCLNRAITMTRDHAYAHHIQRLMVTGNFALLCGVKPEALCDWYLAVYADAHEWVELPNTLGMVLHADGGYLGSKPYCASGKYINRMSDHCRHCRYDVKSTTGDNACPFNSLYWDFLERHERELAGNHRMKLIYGSLHRMSDERRRAQRDKARQVLEAIRFEPAYGREDHLAGYRS
ncbi:deoxyribodipyrimidine photolyase-related protein [Kushneria sinocarnis]|uniref:Deoxyribodipyrimidine photolyase-related protein n=1 Tax=Kushneria sinocarnis TaxID=595502 RepID=A0A420WZ54_9GAMM|nr:cryptochrome/photolyase family protein [Kushneria sinocarnis]RKR06621.1 deoxyribodipyrimidine photolyase-related protein [Kushneria sinocarnis]